MASKNGRLRKLNKNNSHPPTKPCEWCGQSLPTVKYHLRICPDCRRASINAFVKSVRK